MARKTMRKLAAVLKGATNGAVSNLKLVSDGKDKSLKFTGQIEITDNGVATVYDVAADNGRIKRFADVDGFVKLVAQYLPTNDGNYNVAVETGLLLAERIPTDLTADAASKVTKFTAKKATQEAVVVELDAQLALMPNWENGNALQVARKAEVTAQKAAVVEDVAELTALIAFYGALAG